MRLCRCCKNIVSKHIVILSICIAFVIFCIHIGSCPIKRMIGFDCPTCGVTRAMFSLVKGDFADYAKYHVLALPLVIATLFQVHCSCFKNKAIRTTITVFTTLIVIGNFLIYIIKL